MCYSTTMEELGKIRETLARYGLSPNKALGQNFLVDGEIAGAIAAAASPEGRTVVEVGPGLGALTARLLETAERVVAVEKDAAMAEALRMELPGEKLTVLREDFLHTDVAALTHGQPFSAAGNLPYYITTPIVEKLLCLRPEALSLMVQAEAGERFFAGPGERVYGPVAVLSQSLYIPSLTAKVPRDRFYPQPEVDSVAVRLTPLADTGAGEAAGFLRFLKRCFAMRRKTLKNNLSDVPCLPGLLKELGLPGDVRGEALPPETLLALYRGILQAEGKNRI